MYAVVCYGSHILLHDTILYFMFHYVDCSNKHSRFSGPVFLSTAAACELAEDRTGAESTTRNIPNPATWIGLCQLGHFCLPTLASASIQNTLFQHSGVRHLYPRIKPTSTESRRLCLAKLCPNSIWWTTANACSDFADSCHDP